jgi:hypothetical protein
MRFALLALGSAACGRSGFGQDAVDAKLDGGALTACEHAWIAGPTLSNPQLLTSVRLTGGEEYDPFVSFDGLTLYLSSRTFQIYSAHRPTRDAVFGTPSLVDYANTVGNQTLLSLSRDELEAWMSTDRCNCGTNYDVYRATRASTSVPFGTFTRDAILSSPVADSNPVLSDDGLRLYLDSPGRSGGVGGSDIWMASRATTSDAFGAPAVIPEIDTMYDEASASITTSECVMVFAATRPGGIGVEDLWYATRASRSDPFDSPRLVPNVNVAAPDKAWMPALSKDGCELYYVSTPSGANEIWVAKIAP